MKGKNRRPAFNRGQWEVQRERLRLEDRRPPDAPREPMPLDTVLPSLLKRLGLEAQHWLTTLNEEWASLVGQGVARHARPGRLESGVLTVYVDSSVWLSELSRYGKEEILTKLRGRFGAKRFKGLRLQLDPDAGSYSSSSGRRGSTRSTSSRR